MKTCKSYLFRTCYNKGVSHHHLSLVDAQKQAEEWESFMAEKKGKLQMCPD